jgi:hypothetical protein
MMTYSQELKNRHWSVVALWNESRQENMKKHPVSGPLPGGNVWVPNPESPKHRRHQGDVVEAYRLRMSRWTLEVLPTMDEEDWQGLLDWINGFGHDDAA